MSRYTRQALALLWGADIAVQTIANSFEIGQPFREQLTKAHAEIVRISRAWPGTLGNPNEGAWIAPRLKEWTEQVKKDIRLGQWVMCTLASVAHQAVTDLYERPSTRMQRPTLDPLLDMLTEIYYTVAGKWQAEAQANALAEQITGELRKLVGLEDVKAAWPWERAA
jgi:hypothetical protein